MRGALLCQNTEYRGPLAIVKYRSEQAEEAPQLWAWSTCQTRLRMRALNAVCVSLRAQVKGVVKQQFQSFLEWTQVNRLKMYIQEYTGFEA